jgi:hypothetical protein
MAAEEGGAVSGIHNKGHNDTILNQSPAEWKNKSCSTRKPPSEDASQYPAQEMTKIVSPIVIQVLSCEVFILLAPVLLGYHL